MFDNFFIVVGRHIISFLYFLGGITNLTLKTLYFSFVPPYKKERIYEQAEKSGLASLPLVSLIALYRFFLRFKQPILCRGFVRVVYCKHGCSVIVRN